MRLPPGSVKESLDHLRAATLQDVTLAICEVQNVRRTFAAAADELSLRIGRLETKLAELELATPLLLPFDEPLEQGRRIKAWWVNLFWVALVVLCIAALVAGYCAGRMWRR